MTARSRTSRFPSIVWCVVALAAAQGGLAAETWQPINTGLTNLNVRAIAVDPANENVLYVGTLGGIFKSTNKGQTWAAASTGLIGTTVTGIEIVPTDSNTIYAGTSAGGIHVSTNAGSSWTQINNGLPTMSVNAVGVRRDLPTTLYAGMNTFGIGWSVDAGGTWQPSGVTGTARQFAVDPLAPATAYASTMAGVMKTTDGGGSWSSASVGLPGPSIFDIAADTRVSGVVFCGPLSNRVYKSTNGGSSWAFSGTGIAVGATAVAVYVTVPIGSSAAVYAGTDSNGVYRSIDGGATWQRIISGLTNLSSNLGALTGSRSNPRDVYVGTPSGVFHLTAAPLCGNGALEEGEPCDDGNTANGDCCSSTCQFEAAASTCNDGSVCTSNDACDGAGVCVGGSSLDCDDGNICTTDTCDSSAGCGHTDNTDVCDDGNACTFSDSCSGGTCGGLTVTCDDGNACTTDSCDPASGCVHTNNTAACDDGNACTSGDTCGGGTCQGGAAVTCDDGNVCTTDSCDSATGCVYTNNTAACDDGNACTSDDTCGGGGCHGGLTITCNDDNACTTDSCDPASGCVYTNNTAACDDGNACTTGDTCGGGTCDGGATVTCEDDNECTTDTCNPGTGCQHEAIPGCGGECAILPLTPADGSSFQVGGASRGAANRSIPTFTWSSTCTMRYRIEFSNSPAFQRPALFAFPAQGIAGTSFTPNYGNWTAISNLAKNRGGTGTVYWRVVGDGSGGHYQSAASSLQIESSSRR
jgi:cysteine-rich repeat protein